MRYKFEVFPDGAYQIKDTELSRQTKITKFPERIDQPVGMDQDQRTIFQLWLIAEWE